MGQFSLDHLTDVEFEQFCYDLLLELSFTNMNWRKGTGLSSSPSDRGRDIECRLIVKDIDEETYLETWFIECKHYKQGVPPDAIQGALSWAASERPDKLLIIASNFLSNPTKDYLQDYIKNNRPTFKIKIWEKPLIEKLSLNKIDLLKKYKIIDTHPITDFAISERIFIARLEAFEDMLCRVVSKLGFENIRKDLVSLDETWDKFVRKSGFNDSRYLEYIRGVKAAGFVYAHGEGEHSIEKVYNVEDLNDFSEQLTHLMICVDAYAQLNRIKY